MGKFHKDELIPVNGSLKMVSGWASSFLQWFKASSVPPYFLSILGFLAFIIQSWKDILIQTSFIDEGGYLYLGSLYARGILQPFQEFGPRSIYAPLSQLIPGYIQAWFGPGLLTGRLFSLFLGLLTLAGVWLVAFRLSGKWGAAFVVIAVALTPAQIMVFSAAISEVLVSCLLVWMLFFILGEKRTLTHIIIGSLLTGLIVMTRQNMAPLVPIVIAFIFWQHGKKAGLLSLASSLLPIIIFHALYWPNILILWTRWLPPSLTPFLDSFRPIGESSWAEISIPFSTRLTAFFQAILFNYIPVLGAIIAVFVWPGKKEWKNQFDRRSSIFLAVLFWTLFGLHAYATVLDNSNNPCTFCLTPYLSFFNLTSLLLICITIQSWRKKIPRLMMKIITISILVLSGGLGYASFEKFGAWLLRIRFPSIHRGWNPQTWFPGFTLADKLSYYFSIDFWSARRYISSAIGLIIGSILLLVALILHRNQKREGDRHTSYGYYLIMVIFIAGFIISPVAGGDYREEGICSNNIPNNYEKIGAQLTAIIPPGSQIFWEVSNAVPLLYTPEISIYPAQVYAVSSFRIADNEKELLRLGYWNTSIRSKWMDEADFLVTQPYPTKSYSYPLLDIDFSKFIEYKLSPLNPCNPKSYLLVYERK